MKKLTAYELVHVITIHESNKSSYKINVSDLYHMHDAVEDSPIYIQCHLGKETFESIEERYPNHITISRTSIEIRNLSSLKKKLDVQMMYFKDDEFYNIIWEKWCKIR